MTAESTDRATNTNARASSTIKTVFLFAAVTAWAFLTGYYRMFAVFGGWDDEGYLMMTVKQFLAGDVLYSEIWTLYGPAYYIYKWIVHGLLALPNTHDVNKATTLVMWVLMSLLSGLLTRRFTRSSVWAAATFALVFLTLFFTAVVPTHPQELCGGLIVAALLAIPGDNQKPYFTLRLILTGALCSGVVLTKINIGVFLGLALAIAFAAFAIAKRLQRLLLIGLSAAAAALPFVLLRSQLSRRWLELCVLIAAAVICVLLIGLVKQQRGVFAIKDYAIVSLSFLITGFLMFAATMPAGTTPLMLLDGLVLTPLKFSGYATAPTGGVYYRAANVWSIVAVVAAAAILFFRKKNLFAVEVAVSLLQAMFGLATILAVLIGYYDVALKIVEKIGAGSAIVTWVHENQSLGHFVILNLSTPFLWLLLVKQVTSQNFSADFVPRTALVLTAVLLTIQIYPLPGGSHIAIAVFPMMIVAVVCLHDACKELKTLFPRWFAQPRLRAGLTLLAASGLILFGVHRTYTSRENYNSLHPLRLAGAQQMRLTESEVVSYNFVAHNIMQNCDSFISMPSFFSLNFWADKQPPTPYNVNWWMILLDISKQQTIVKKLQTTQNGCAVYSSWWTNNGLTYLSQGQTMESSPLAAHILNNYTGIGTVNGYQFMRQNGSPPRELVYAARILSAEQNRIEFTLPPGFEHEIHRVELFNLAAPNAIFDSRTAPIALFDRQNSAISFPLPPPNDAAVRKYKIAQPNLNPADLAEPRSLVLRLYDGNNRIVAHLPFPIDEKAPR